MTMTLQEARDWLVEVRKRNAVNASLDNMDDHDAEAVIQALDAHIAAMGEPVAWMTKSGHVMNVRTRERVLANAELGGGFAVAAKAAEDYSIPLYSAPPAQDSDAKDAARYRWLRDTPWLGTSLEPVITQQRNAHWDAAIDAAMAQESQP